MVCLTARQRGYIAEILSPPSLPKRVLMIRHHRVRSTSYFCFSSLKQQVRRPRGQEAWSYRGLRGVRAGGAHRATTRGVLGRLQLKEEPCSWRRVECYGLRRDGIRRKDPRFEGASCRVVWYAQGCFRPGENFTCFLVGTACFCCFSRCPLLVSCARGHEVRGSKEPKGRRPDGTYDPQKGALVENVGRK